MSKEGNNFNLIKVLPIRDGMQDILPPAVLTMNESSAHGNLKSKIAGFDETQKILEEARSYTEQPFDEAAQEIKKLAAFYKIAFGELTEAERTNPTEFQQFILDRLLKMAKIEDKETRKKVGEILSSHFFVFRDTLTFGAAIQTEAELIDLPEHAHFIYYPTTREVVKFVRPEAFNLLSRSRMLGLYPFEVLDRLRDLDIRCIGASVAAQLIDLLVSLGAPKITIADAGRLEVSNGPRLTSQMADIRNLGDYKLSPLISGLYGRNPYGNFKAFAGRVIAGTSGLAEDGTQEMSATEFFEGAGLVVEVIDSARDKIGIRLVLRDYGLDFPVVFVVDTADAPMATIETRENNPFNSDIGEEGWRQMLAAMEGAENEIHQRGAALASVIQMVGANLTESHSIVMGQILAGQQIFISQDPGDTRTSASLSSRLILEMLGGNIPPGKTYTQGELELIIEQREVNRHLMLDILKRGLNI